MNKTYLKLTTRGIKKSKTRFLSILGIVALGAGFLVGLLASTPDMKASADAYYDKQNTFDIKIQGTLGITQDDIEVLNTKPYVDKAEGILTTDATVMTGDEEGFTARIKAEEFDKKDTINKLSLVEGRYPKTIDECVIAVPDTYTYKHKLGETITINPQNRNYEELIDTFSQDQFKVVGIVSSPEIISLHGEITNVGVGKITLAVYVMGDAYAKKDLFTAGFITIDGKENISSFSSSYRKLVSKTSKKIKEVGIERSKIRREEIVDKAQAELEVAEKKYIEEREKALGELAQGEQKLEDGKYNIDMGRVELTKAKEELDAKEQALLAQEEQLRQVKPEIDRLKEILAAGGALPPEALEQIKAYNKAVESIDWGKEQIARGREQLNSKRDELSRGSISLKEEEKKYQREKARAMAELADGEQKIQDAKVKIEEIDKAKWYVQDRSDNVGMYNYKSDVEKIGAVSKVFPIFFFLVAVLVALTTMTRMIEEERSQIGALKSLGYSNWDILKYYLSYSFFATAIGCIVGEGIGFVLFPKVISNAYSMMYNLPPIKVSIIWSIAIPVSLIITLGILMTSYIALRMDLKEKPASLLLPKTPKNGKRILLERITPLWKRLRFTQKVTLRNLFRYKKRFLMTIVGVAGCFALLLAGFGIRDSISDIVNRQYGDINLYDYKMQVSEEKWIDGDEILYNTLHNEDLVKAYGRFNGDPVTIVGKDKTWKSNLVIPQDREYLPKFIHLGDRHSGKKIEFNSNSVVLTEKAASTLKVDVGEKIKIRLANGREAEVELTAIAENYVGSYLYLTPEIYKESFGNIPTYNEVLIQGEKAKVSTELLRSSNVQYVLPTANIKENFKSSVASIDYVVWVLILAAGALAVIVLYNLTNVNICERKRELATIKVLGFYEREVSKYIFREINILTGLGIVLGVPAGVLLHKFVMKTVEVEQVMFGRNIYWQSYIYSALLTIGFALLVNLIMRKSIKKIDMVESMKANE